MYICYPKYELMKKKKKLINISIATYFILLHMDGNVEKIYFFFIFANTVKINKIFTLYKILPN